MRQLKHMEWRLVQLFLDDKGIHEFELDINDNRSVRCSCDRFKKRGDCKHSKWMDTAILESGGHYTIQVPETVDEVEAAIALDDPDDFRDFIIKYGKVEVI